MGLFSKLKNGREASSSCAYAEEASTASAEVLYDNAMHYIEQYVDSDFADMDARAKAKCLLEKAVGQGYAKAYEQLASFYIQGEPDEDLVRVKDLLTKASDLGFSTATVKLALCYTDGWGVEKDEQKAIALLSDLADDGNINALWNLGDLYSNEDMDSYDPSKAFTLMLRLANMNALNSKDENDVQSARFRVGNAYLEGEGVERNELEGLKWLALSAVQGYHASLGNIGREFVLGVRVPLMPDYAKRYYLAALKTAPDCAYESKALYCRAISNLISDYGYLADGEKDASYWGKKSEEYSEEQ